MVLYMSWGTPGDQSVETHSTAPTQSPPEPVVCTNALQDKQDAVLISEVWPRSLYV